MVNAFLLVSLVFVAASTEAELRIFPSEARPGDALLIDVISTSPVVSGKIGTSDLHFFDGFEGHRALFGLSVDEPKGALAVKIVLQDGKTVEGAVTILDAQFQRKTLTVPKKYTSPPKSVRRWMAEDKKAFAQAFQTRTNYWLFQDSFILPREALVTAPFGDLRLFNGKKDSQHFGLDLEGKPGDPVLAAQQGTVVMRRSCYAAGNTILLHHGGNLFSAYFHLTEFRVAPGEKVLRGQLLGTVGKTGRVTGPHLHWGVKVEERWVNPESVLKLPLQQRTYRKATPETSDAGS